jgi:hypothetical protein
MPIQKFKDLDEARKALWRSSGSSDLVLRIKKLWAFSERLTPFRIPRGVRKFRSIEEANLERDQWIEHRVRTLRAERVFQD